MDTTLTERAALPGAVDNDLRPEPLSRGRKHPAAVSVARTGHARDPRELARPGEATALRRLVPLESEGNQ